MRGPFFATLAVISGLIATSTPAYAQRGAVRGEVGVSDLRAMAPQPTAQFRRRTLDERLDSVRRLMTEQARRAPRNSRVVVTPVAGDQLGDAFALTPRQPYLEQRGSLSVANAFFVDTSTSPSGYVSFLGDRPPEGVPIPIFFNTKAMLEVFNFTENAHRRILIECTVSQHSGPFSATLGGAASWSDTSAPYNGVVSFFAPPFPGHSGLLLVGIRPLAQGPAVSWTLSGCEISYVSV